MNFSRKPGLLTPLSVVSLVACCIALPTYAVSDDEGDSPLRPASKSRTAHDALRVSSDQPLPSRAQDDLWGIPAEAGPSTPVPTDATPLQPVHHDADDESDAPSAAAAAPIAPPTPERLAQLPDFLQGSWALFQEDVARGALTETTAATRFASICQKYEAGEPLRAQLRQSAQERDLGTLGALLLKATEISSASSSSQNMKTLFSGILRNTLLAVSQNQDPRINSITLRALHREASYTYQNATVAKAHFQGILEALEADQGGREALTPLTQERVQTALADLRDSGTQGKSPGTEELLQLLREESLLCEFYVPGLNHDPKRFQVQDGVDQIIEAIYTLPGYETELAQYKL